MALTVEIDKRSGFCGGVIRAISKAEEFLDANPGKRLYSLGAIVHNEAELGRLESKGLVTISKEEIRNIHNPSSETLLIRAHGEPPSTYELAREVGINVIDCTCPVVLKLQQNIGDAHRRLNIGAASSGGSTASNGQVLVFGKVGHAEVLGLLGQVGGDAVVIENMDMLLSALEDGTIRTDMPLEIFSQTTKSPTEYSEICSVLAEKAQGGLTVHNTICKQVASRHEELAEFAASHDIIIFVSGASSSNGKVLCDLCRSRNPRTYHISSAEEINPSWFRADDRVGVCGATSTPRWLLEAVANAVMAIQLSP
ncbi:MAG: 4-hydroxy-3-methylbut-2-enyl diphosphate reductase [Bacteroidales bacterium]|nr:4-hydroxy-3-methylbut-2-enyl diphosphate reductase [Bacteroidales bacterium]